MKKNLSTFSVLTDGTNLSDLRVQRYDFFLDLPSFFGYFFQQGLTADLQRVVVKEFVDLQQSGSGEAAQKQLDSGAREEGEAERDEF